MDLSGHEHLRIAPSAALIGRPSSPVGRALFGALLASAAVAALPTSLLDLAIASLGLSEALPSLAPPFGWASRVLLALSAGVIAAAILLIFGSLSSESENASTHADRSDTMNSAAPSGWQRLASFARGNAAAPARTDDRRPRDMKWRRADLHPDAPLPAPLFASRDLPSGVFDAPDRGTPSAERFRPSPVTERQPPFLSVDFDPARPPVRDLSRHDRPRPLPRSPEPLSEEEVEALRGLLRAIPEPETLPVQPDAGQDAVAPPTIEPDAPLTALLGRFEKSVEERIALADAQDAAMRLDQTLNRSGDPLPTEHPSPQPETVDHALRDALEALRVLSAGKRESGRRR